MKKLLLSFMVGIIVVLSSCSADMDGIDDEPSIYGFLKYDFNSMTYTNTPDTDILYQVDNTYNDFIIVLDRELSTPLTQVEKEAFMSLFNIIDQLVESTNLKQSDVLELSSSDFNTQLTNNSITLSVADLITFNSYKLIIEELKTAVNQNDIHISKFDYIEETLEIHLNNDETDALDLLQSRYEELFNTTYQPFDFKNSSLNDLLVAFDEDLDYTPTDGELIRLEIAYDLLTQLFNN
ncbi:MAG: hypothetical protein QM489_01265 [Candidatus Izemoplasma sp.]